jgi:hypothetical protein
VKATDQTVFGEESTAANSKLKTDTFLKPPIAKLAAEPPAANKETVSTNSIFGNNTFPKPEKSLFDNLASKPAIDENKPAEDVTEKV